MSAVLDALRIQPPASFDPYIDYTRALDRFNGHAQDLPSVFSYIAYRNAEAKSAGLNEDEAELKMAELLKGYFEASKTDEESATIFADFFAEYKIPQNGIEYFGYWLEGYTKKAKAFFAAKEKLEALAS